MILIGGEKFPQSMTGVADLADGPDGTAAIAARSIWVADFTAVVGRSVAFPPLFTYPSNAKGYWRRAVSSDPNVLTVDSAARVLNPVRAGSVTLTWTAENADGTVATYQQTVQVSAT